MKIYFCSVRIIPKIKGETILLIIIRIKEKGLSPSDKTRVPNWYLKGALNGVICLYTTSWIRCPLNTHGAPDLGQAIPCVRCLHLYSRSQAIPKNEGFFLGTFRTNLWALNFLLRLTIFRTYFKI